VDPAVIRALVEGIPGPINVVYGQGKLSLAELAALGVARVSFGPSLQRQLYNKFGPRCCPPSHPMRTYSRSDTVNDPTPR